LCWNEAGEGRYHRNENYRDFLHVVLSFYHKEIGRWPMINRYLDTTGSIQPNWLSSHNACVAKLRLC
jgi:hypothetical protein